jgi:hypothetical protein
MLRQEDDPMTERSAATFRRLGLSLAALTLFAAGPLMAGGGSAHPRATFPELDARLVPSDAVAFVTFCPADLAGKLGLEGRAADRMPLFAACKRQLGVSAHHIERYTALFLSSPADPVWIVRGNESCDRDRVLGAVAPGAEEVKRHGKACHVSKAAGTAVHFVDDRQFVAGPEEAVTTWLKQKGGTGRGTLSDAVALTADHDVVAWSRATPAPDGPPTPQAGVTSAKRRTAGSGRAVVRVALRPDDSLRAPGGPARRPAGPVVLVGVPLALPPAVESATATVDIGEEVSVKARLHCTDEAGARGAVKAVRALVAGARGELLMAYADLEMADYVSPENRANVSPAVTKEVASSGAVLLRQAERGLQRVRVQAEGADIPVAVRLPVDAQKILLFARLCEAGVFSDEEGCSPPQPIPEQTYTLPPAEDPRFSRPPQVPEQVLNKFPKKEAGAPSAAGCSAPVPTVSGLMPASAVPTVAEKVPVKLTVANVTKEPALLFSVGDGGKLVFSRKVPAGEAVDVKSSIGQRWVAVFAEKPAGDTFTAEKVEATWLLR